MGKAASLVDEPCSTCEFALWVPVLDLGCTSLGIYDDSRFPGRCILALNEHFESLEEVPDGLASVFMRDAKLCMTALRRATDASRVNFAILGNRDPHVHAHLIPRHLADPRPNDPPWTDPRAKDPLSARELRRLRVEVASAVLSIAEERSLDVRLAV